MWNGNYHPDVIVETFVRFHPHRSFTRQELVDYDAELFAANDALFTAALQARGLSNPSLYDKSKLLQIACVSPGDFDAAVNYAAGAYIRALSLGDVID
jgi:hypothetical protein